MLSWLLSQLRILLQKEIYTLTRAILSAFVVWSCLSSPFVVHKVDLQILRVYIFALRIPLVAYVFDWRRLLRRCNSETTLSRLKNTIVDMVVRPSNWRHMAIGFARRNSCYTKSFPADRHILFFSWSGLVKLLFERGCCDHGTLENLLFMVNCRLLRRDRNMKLFGCVTLRTVILGGSACLCMAQKHFHLNWCCCPFAYIFVVSSASIGFNKFIAFVALDDAGFSRVWWHYRVDALWRDYQFVRQVV